MDAEAEKEIDITTTDARAGVTGTGLRYMLAVGLLLAIIAMGLALAFYAR
jgi:hypothetical protein